MENEDFVTYEQALALKKLGFSEECLYFYIDKKSLLSNTLYGNGITLKDFYDNFNFGVSCSAPTLAQVQKWLRKEKNLSVEPFSSLKKGKYTFEIIFVDTGYDYKSSKTTSYILDTYEEALSEGIDFAIKLLEK